jgi:alkylation response protein AidB-like acyl-CoA dehydrogenase
MRARQSMPAKVASALRLIELPFDRIKSRGEWIGEGLKQHCVQLEMMFRDRVELARAARLPDGSAALAHEDVRHELACLLTKVEAAKRIVEDVVDRILRDEEHPSDGAVAKLAYSERFVGLCEAALERLAPAASVEEPGREATERGYEAFLRSRALTISGGASEILRGLLGRQLLALPRA